jgi:uncharacterized protein
MAQELSRSDELRRVLEVSRTIVVLGAHPSEWRPAHYVPRYLAEQGYRVVPVNPRFAGKLLWGEPVRARLTDVLEPCDLLDVFRRADDLMPHVEEILAMTHRPKVVWLQSGIVNDAFCAALIEAGIDVVQDACTYALHRRFGLTSRGGAIVPGA